MKKEDFQKDLMGMFLDEVRELFPDLRDVVFDAGRAFLNDARVDLERWTELLSSGALSDEEFEWLVQSRVNLLEMETLRQAGLSLVRIDELRQALTRSVIGASLHFIGL